MTPAIVIAVSAFFWIAAAAAEDTPSGAPAEWGKPVMDSEIRVFAMMDQLEYRLGDGDDVLRWEGESWLGGDYNKLVLETEGEQKASGAGGEAEFHLLYGRAIAPFWDFRVGARQDVIYGAGTDRRRTFFVLGIEGLAPHWFEVAPALFVSDEGDVSARIETTYDLLLTQRLIAQPRFETNMAAQDARKYGIESGVNDVELGLRLRYEIIREIAPYIGINWLRKVGNTADLARKEGEDVDSLAFVAGFRVWY